MRLHFTIGCYNRRRTSRCRHGFQFSGIMCIDAPESTTNSLPSGLRVDVAGRHQFSEGEKNAVSFFSFNFWDFFGQPPRCFTGTSVLPFRLLLRPILNFCSVGYTLMRITRVNQSKRWILVSSVSMTYHSLRESNTSYWFQYVWALPQKRWRLRRLHILKDATQFSCNFQHSHCTYCHHSFFDILLGCSSTWRCAKEHFSPKRQPFLSL